MKKDEGARHFFTDIRFQLFYGIFLIVLIPLIILFNTIFIINRYNEDIDTILQRQALLVSRVLSSTIQGDFFDGQMLQKKILEIQEENSDILSIHVLVPEEGGFRAIASTLSENINQVIDFYYYDIAFRQRENQALATDSVRFSKDGRAERLELLKYAERFWLVSLPLFNEAKQRVGLLSIQISSAVVDELTRQSWKASVYSLTLSILVAVLFLAASARLWEYATLYRKMKEVDAMKDEFISIASHELRTPITAMRGYVSMVLDGSFGEISEKARGGLGNIQKSAKRLGDLVEDLLNVSRIEQGRILLDMKSANPKNVIAEVVEELSVQAKEKNLSLEYKAGRAPNIFVDADKFKQVLINIIGNAIKYTKAGSVFVTLGVKDNFVEIKVKDTGIGMSAEEQQRLFEKFFRARSEKTQGILGTGLGLWITKQLVELMKGKIYIESMEGTGTQVTLLFPPVKKEK